mmetsp:Transcript_35761/g.99093  ORF Transcript_35761/g.99093 Transcript_35761/m.99093 type:complete len:201 (+) Transcript_35761:2993-3595(+)
MVAQDALLRLQLRLPPVQLVQHLGHVRPCCCVIGTGLDVLLVLLHELVYGFHCVGRLGLGRPRLLTDGLHLVRLRGVAAVDRGLHGLLCVLRKPLHLAYPGHDLTRDSRLLPLRHALPDVCQLLGEAFQTGLELVEFLAAGRGRTLREPLGSKPLHGHEGLGATHHRMRSRGRRLEFVERAGSLVEWQLSVSHEERRLCF